MLKYIVILVVGIFFSFSVHFIFMNDKKNSVISEKNMPIVDEDTYFVDDKYDFIDHDMISKLPLEEVNKVKDELKKFLHQYAYSSNINSQHQRAIDILDELEGHSYINDLELSTVSNPEGLREMEDYLFLKEMVFSVDYPDLLEENVGLMIDLYHKTESHLIHDEIQKRMLSIDSESVEAFALDLVQSEDKRKKSFAISLLEKNGIGNKDAIALLEVDIESSFLDDESLLPLLDIASNVKDANQFSSSFSESLFEQFFLIDDRDVKEKISKTLASSNNPNVAKYLMKALKKGGNESKLKAMQFMAGRKAISTDEKKLVLDAAFSRDSNLLVLQEAQNLLGQYIMSDQDIQYMRSKL